MRVAAYRLQLRAGIHPVQRIPAATLARGEFFDAPRLPMSSPTPPARTLEYFGWFTPDGDGVPDWHRNAITGVLATDIDRDWWTIPDFDPELGDVKTIWEPSRFDWVMTLAQAARARDPGALGRLNEWLSDWCVHNPPYRGHNWKCGQECSIRVLHLAIAALLLEQTHSRREELIALITTHLRRIAPTIAYAVGQNNNHGTSEAAALFVGGSWLEALGRPEGANWARTGRRWLAERVRELVAEDGSFSQYSVTYHRLVLDTLSIAEIWRRHLGLGAFADPFLSRARAATRWLHALTDPATGDAPNLGANDGANLLPLTDSSYRDFRPAVQRAAALFLDARAYEGASAADDSLRWLGIDLPKRRLEPAGDHLFAGGGYGVVRSGRAAALLRFPRFRFRPSHADALHVDLWVDGVNVLRDGGSFSYADPEWHAYFTGVAAHNTVQFDDREPMPRLGRFLWGAWVRTLRLEPIARHGSSATIGAAYQTSTGALHERRIALHDDRCVVTDSIAGFERRAVLRWRLRPGDWTLVGTTVTDGEHRLTVASTAEVVRRELVTGWESRLYLRRSEIPVLEVELATAGECVSEYVWGR